MNDCALPLSGKSRKRSNHARPRKGNRKHLFAVGQKSLNLRKKHFQWNRRNTRNGGSQFQPPSILLTQACLGSDPHAFQHPNQNQTQAQPLLLFAPPRFGPVHHHQRRHNNNNNNNNNRIFPPQHSNASMCKPRQVSVGVEVGSSLAASTTPSFPHPPHPTPCASAQATGTGVTSWIRESVQETRSLWRRTEVLQQRHHAREQALLAESLHSSDLQEWKMGSIKFEDLVYSDFVFPISQGSEGYVYKATYFGIPVAVKEIPLDGHPNMTHDQVLVAVANCARLMKTIEHTNVLRCMGWCRRRSHALLVTEWMSGGTLLDLMASYSGPPRSLRKASPLPSPLSSPLPSPHASPMASPCSSPAMAAASWRLGAIGLDSEGHKQESQGLPESQVLHIARQVSNAMCLLHSRGYVHRDLASANILIDAMGRAVVSDFGISCVATSKSSLPNGRYHYAAPELLKRVPGVFDGSIDVYAFGMILVELLSGRHPFQDMSIEHVSELVLSGQRPTSHEPHCSASLRWLIGQCLKASPTERPTFQSITVYLQKHWPLPDRCRGYVARSSHNHPRTVPVAEQKKKNGYIAIL